MNMIRNKLRAKNGVSIFMGLIFLMVCLMVGIVVLTAATAAAGKLTEQRKREQDYLTVASAAWLVRDEICKLTYTYTKEGETSGSGELTTTSPDGRVILKDSLKDLCDILAKADTEAGMATLQDQLKDKKTFKIKLSDTSTKWDTVYGSLRMKTDGRIVIGLWLGDEDETTDDSTNEENGNNHMTIEFCPDGPVKETQTVNKEIGGVITPTVTVTTTCSWPEGGCTITNGMQLEEEEGGP